MACIAPTDYLPKRINLSNDLKWCKRSSNTHFGDGNILLYFDFWMLPQLFGCSSLFSAWSMPQCAVSAAKSIWPCCETPGRLFSAQRWEGRRYCSSDLAHIALWNQTGSGSTGRLYMALMMSLRCALIIRGWAFFSVQQQTHIQRQVCANSSCPTLKGKQAAFEGSTSAIRHITVDVDVESLEIRQNKHF